MSLTVNPFDKHMVIKKREKHVCVKSIHRFVEVNQKLVLLVMRLKCRPTVFLKIGQARK